MEPERKPCDMLLKKLFPIDGLRRVLFYHDLNTFRVVQYSIFTALTITILIICIRSFQ